MRWCLSLFLAVIGFSLLACSVAPTATTPAVEPTAAPSPPAAPTATAAPNPTATPGPPVEIVLTAARDGTLYQHNDGALSNGAGQHLFVGTTAGNSLRRTVIAFDIGGAVPAGSTIINAALTLHLSRTQSGEETVTLHRLLADWDEGDAVASGNEGGGAPSVPGDVTWLHRSFDTVEWSEPGGEFQETSQGHVAVAGTGEYTWESTPEMVADVQAWLDDTAGNYGWLLKGNEERRSTSKRFDSREHENPEVRPRLTVEYLPPPGS